MTHFLLKRFVPDFANSQSPAVRSACGTLSGWVGIVCNLLLFGFKLMAGILTGALSVTADALNNLSDASGSIVTLVGFRLAGRPADGKHPYGHARYEYLSGLAVSAMIGLIGFELAFSALRRIRHPEPVVFTALSAGILVVSLLVKLWLAAFNRKLGKAISSDALLAVAADSRNDCVATAAVLLTGLLETFTGLRVDGFVSLGVAAFILFSGWGLARETISPLLGEGADPELRQKILDFVRSRPGVLGYHDLMVHDYGPGRQYASLHVEMDSREDPLVCHEIIDNMEYECLKQYGIHLVIHYDPVITDDPELAELKEAVESLLKEISPELSLHDFRMIPGRQHRNLVFDVPLPEALRGRETEILHYVEAGMNRDGRGPFHIRLTFDMPEA